MRSGRSAFRSRPAFVKRVDLVDDAANRADGVKAGWLAASADSSAAYAAHRFEAIAKPRGKTGRTPRSHVLHMETTLSITRYL
jgi:hypothetical protein